MSLDIAMRNLFVASCCCRCCRHCYHHRRRLCLCLCLCLVSCCNWDSLDVVCQLAPVLHRMGSRSHLVVANVALGGYYDISSSNMGKLRWPFLVWARASTTRRITLSLSGGGLCKIFSKPTRAWSFVAASNLYFMSHWCSIGDPFSPIWSVYCGFQKPIEPYSCAVLVSWCVRVSVLCVG